MRQASWQNLDKNEIYLRSFEERNKIYSVHIYRIKYLHLHFLYENETECHRYDDYKQKKKTDMTIFNFEEDDLKLDFFL